MPQIETLTTARTWPNLIIVCLVVFFYYNDARSRSALREASWIRIRMEPMPILDLDPDYNANACRSTPWRVK